MIEEDNDVHIWKIQQIHLNKLEQSLRSLLSTEELECAERFYDSSLRSKFICRRGAIRLILGKYTNTKPYLLKFITNNYGKPRLSTEEVRFNVSHSEGMAIIAISKQDIGIDIEYNRPIPDMDIVAKYHFAPIECETLFAMSEAKKTEAFYRCWTRKEAYIKLIGKGLAIPLDSFAVTIDEHEAPKLQFVNYDYDNVGDSSLYNVNVPNSFTAALASTRPISRVSYYDFQESLLS